MFHVDFLTNANFYLVLVLALTKVEMRGIINAESLAKASLWATPYVCCRTPAILTASQKCPCKQAFLLRGIINAEGLAETIIGRENGFGKAIVFSKGLQLLTRRSGKSIGLSPVRL